MLRHILQPLANKAQHQAITYAIACRSTFSTVAAEKSSKDEEIADVVIVGSGMVGAALAALLGANRMTSTMRVVVLDQAGAPAIPWQPAPYPDLRVSTITPATIAMLQRAGAWERVEPNSAAFSHMQVWDSGAQGCIRWSAADVGMARMGHVAENSLLQAALLEAVQRTAPDTTRLMWRTGVADMRLPAYSHAPAASAVPPAGGAAASAAERAASGSGASSSSSAAGAGLAELLLQDGRVLRTRLVVAADGANSRIRQLAGLRTYGWSYNQRGVVATVATSEFNETAWQRFLPTGPLALLPVRDGLSNIVWSVPPELAKQLEALGPQEFADAVNRALNDGAARSPLSSLLRTRDAFSAPPRVEAWVGTSPKSFPLQLKAAGKYVRPRLALIGDAGHAVHPLAGQGVNLGFGDAIQLAEALAAAKQCGADPGDMLFLQDRFERPRQLANNTMMAALDAVKGTFALTPSPLAAVRSFGLDVLNAAGPVKNQIMRFAMGL